MESPDIATVVVFAVYNQASRYAHIATYAATVYEWVLCIEDDVELLSTPGINFAKLSYFSCRYFLLLSYPITFYVQAMNHPLSICLKTFRIPMLLPIPNLGAAVSLLTLRLWAFTGGNRTLVVLIAICYLAVSVYHFWVAFARSVLSPLGPAGRGCAPVGKSDDFELAGFFFGALLLDTFITASFIGHLVRSVKLRFSGMNIITRTCLKQGGLYFVAISAVNLLNVVSFIQPYQPFAGITTPFCLGLPSLLACRMFLGLRKVGRHEGDSAAEITADMRFARGPTTRSGHESDWVSTSEQVRWTESWLPHVRRPAGAHGSVPQVDG